MYKQLSKSFTFPCFFFILFFSFFFFVCLFAFRKNLTADNQFAQEKQIRPSNE